MEPVRGGRLANLDDECTAILRARQPDWSSASWALRFNGALDGVRVVLSGMSTEAQLDDNLATFAAEPLLSAEENDILLEQIVPKMAEMVPCTVCRYCREGCPQSLKIPHLIYLYNEMNFSSR